MPVEREKLVFEIGTLVRPIEGDGPQAGTIVGHRAPDYVSEYADVLMDDGVVYVIHADGLVRVPVDT